MELVVCQRGPTPESQIRQMTCGDCFAISMVDLSLAVRNISSPSHRTLCAGVERPALVLADGEFPKKTPEVICHHLTTGGLDLHQTFRIWDWSDIFQFFVIYNNCLLISVGAYFRNSSTSSVGVKIDY